MCTYLVPWLLQILRHCFPSPTSALQRRFIQAMSPNTHRAAEFRRVHPSRPPPEPDSSLPRMLLLLVVMCSCVRLVDSSSFTHETHHLVPSYASKMSNSPIDPPQAPRRGGTDDETIWSAGRDRYNSLEGLMVGGDDSDKGIGGLSLGEEFDGERGVSRDQSKLKTVKKSNQRRVSVDPDGSEASSDNLPSFNRRATVAGGSPRPGNRFSNARVPPPVPRNDANSGEDVAMRDGLKDLLVGGLLDALGIDPSAAGRKDDGDVEDKDDEKKKSYLPSGIQLRSTARSVDSVGGLAVQITRHNRKNDGSSTQAKLRQRWCTSLKTEFASPDYAKIFSSDSSEDVASLAIGIQDSLKEYSKWCKTTDTLDIYQIAIGVSDHSDLRQVSTAPTKCLLTSYNEISLTDVKSFQAFINLHCDDCETLSSSWCLDKLANSTELTLRRRVLQIHDKLPEAQQGGLTFFKLLADECYKDSYEAQKSLKLWLESFDIRNFDGEDVRVASTKFKAVVDLLGSAAPDKYIKLYLRGMTHASSAKFKHVADTQLGFYGTTPYQMWRSQCCTDERQELDLFASTFITEYNDLSQGKEWSGFGHSASTFKASTTETAAAAATSDKQTSAPAKWKDEKCSIPNCGGAHPTYMHYKLEKSRGRYNRDERNRRNTTPRSDDRKSSDRSRPVRYKGGSNGKKKFEGRMYKAAVDFVHEDDLE